MKRTILLTSLVLLGATAMRAQSLTSISIGTTFTSLSGRNPIFAVDGTNYTSPQTFVWPVGSKHIVQFTLTTDNGGNTLNYQSALNDTIRYQFSGWVPNSSVTLSPGNSNVQTVTADPGLTSLFAQVTATYRVHITLPNPGPDGAQNCSGAPGDALAANRQGIVYVGATCYSQSTDFTTDPFMAAGSYSLNAFPYPGWVFFGWSLGNNPPNYLSTIAVSGPTNILAMFSVAKRVNFITNPLGLQILIDGTIVNTPGADAASSDGVSCAPDYSRLPPGAPGGFTPLCLGQFDFLPGSKHTIGAPGPQTDKASRYWVFRQFSNGAGQNASYIAGTNTSSADTMISNFAQGHHVSILTNPGRLKVAVDGRDNWPGYSFIWGEGETHHVVAETPQNDSRGRVYQFGAWSDVGDAGRDIVVGTSDMSVTANYSVLSQVTITSSTASINFTADGSPCPSPCVLNKISGSQSQVAVPASVGAGTGMRYDFVSWSDGNTSPTRTVSFSQDTMALTATYQTSYQFTGLINPAKAGTYKVTPTSPDGFYASGTQLAVSVVSNGGFKFAHWEGDLTGQFAPGTVTMDGPHTVQADFATIPFIPPAGIQSVTGPTPDGSVAPGSIISIYGQNLAPSLQIGPTNPLSQALANVNVTIGDFLLPLVFVSPDQIGAQVPWEIAAGTYTLIVHSAGQPDVPATVTITRNAPGVFTQANDQNLPLALALHHDGTVVNFQNPAALGEQITIFGTGFGPYDHPAVDGFPAASIDKSNLLDPISVNTDAVSLLPDWAGPAPGMTGVNALKLTVTNDMPASSNVNITVQVNGKSSAQVVIPVQ
ncbi:MAG TPA: IPT/TIG domain-containing protein [Bryobacteraceae bacterium]|nr:IPT/TIG domain-containing protein [Bryobacteraceae bacterium]